MFAMAGAGAGAAGFAGAILGWGVSFARRSSFELQLEAPNIATSAKTTTEDAIRTGVQKVSFLPVTGFSADIKYFYNYLRLNSEASITSGALGCQLDDCLRASL